MSAFFHFLIVSRVAANAPLCSSSLPAGPCGVPVAYGPNLNAANHGIGFKHFKGTLDSLLNTTPLEYRLYKQGKVGWNLDSEFLEASGLTSPTSRACYDSNYFCAPGPCSVLDINYLYDIQNEGIGQILKTSDPSIVYGKSYCGPVFGTQLLYTANQSVYPTNKANKLALSKLPGPLPSKTQEYIPSNDIVNSIPAWWYTSFEGWMTGNKAKLRKAGASCMSRIVPEWMIPYAAQNRGKTRDFNDEDVSFQKTEMYDVDMDLNADQQRYGSQRDLPMAPDTGQVYPYYTLCDSDFLKGVFLGYSAAGHTELDLNKTHEDLAYSLYQLRVINPDPDSTLASTRVHTIVQAVKYFLESYQQRGKFCLGNSPSTCNFPQFLYEEYQRLHANVSSCVGLNSSVSNATNCTYSLGGTEAERNTASLAMMAGQLFTIVRPCESFRSRQGKLMSATYNHWRRAHFNPGNNRAAFEHSLGCNPEASNSDRGACRAVRKEIEWETPSSCVPLGGCSTVGYDCCTASGSPALTQDARSNTKAAEFMPYAYTTQELQKDGQCATTLGNEENVATDGFKPGVLSGGAKWPYSTNKDGIIKGLSDYKPFRCGIKMERQPARWCKTRNSGEYVTSGSSRFYAVPLCKALGGSSNYFRLFNTFSRAKRIETVEESIFASAYSPRSRVLTDNKITEACRNYNVLSAFFSFLVNCIVHVVEDDPTLIEAGFNTLEGNLVDDGYGNATTAAKKHSGIMALNFQKNGGEKKRVYGTCVAEERAWKSDSDPFVPSDSTSGLTWATVVYRSVHRVRKRLLPSTSFTKSTTSIRDTTLVGLEPRGWTWDRKMSKLASIKKFLGGKCTAGKGRCSIDRHPPDLKGPFTTNGARFMQHGYIGRGTGPNQNVADVYCKGRYTTAVVESISTAAVAYKLYESTEGQMDIADQSYEVGGELRFGRSEFTSQLSNASYCGWSSEYVARLQQGRFVGGPKSSFTSPLDSVEYDVYDKGYWEHVEIKALGRYSAVNLPVYKFSSATLVGNNPYAGSNPTKEDAIELCREYRYLNCVGVQQVPTTAIAFDFYLISRENLLRGESIFQGNNSHYKFYPVPCYTLETTSDLFGCNKNPTGRNVSVRTNMNPRGIPLWAPAVPLYAGMQESYLLDGLGHYTSNARFTLNTSGFIENTMGIGMATEQNKANGVSMDFDLSQWIETQENIDRGRRIPLPAFQGPGGLAVNHFDGIRHVPKHSSGILDDVKKTQLFSWAGMFDVEGWVNDRKYQFQHPSHKHSDQFLYYPNSSGIDVSLSNFGDGNLNITFKVNDVFVRAMTSVPLDLVNNDDHKAQWTELFFNRIRNIMVDFNTTGQSSRISTVSCAAGLIVVGSDFEVECLLNSTHDDSFYDTYGAYMTPLASPDGVTWGDFTSKYEHICDLHACDIVSTVPVKFLESTVYQPQDSSSGQGFNCVPKGYSYFQRGMSPVDADLLQSNDNTPFEDTEVDVGTHIQSAFGYLGFAITSIEATILRDVILSRYNYSPDPTGSPSSDDLSLLTAWRAAVDESAFQKDLWYACARVAKKNGIIMNSVETCTDVLKAQSVRGYPDTIVKSQWTNDNSPPKNVATNSKSILSQYVSDTSKWQDSVDYSALDTSDLYTEHREAIPVFDMSRSASYSNLEQDSKAVPCDCDNQEIVWMCNRIVSEGTNSPLADKYNFSNDVPQSTKYWTTKEEYGDSIQLVECGYSWAVPPRNTPKIGLYVPSKVDLFEVYERDIYSGYRHAPVDGSCIEKFNQSLFNNVSCLRNARLSALLKACATETFSIPMAPNAAKLKSLLFTGRHPIVSGLAAQNNAKMLYDDGFITEDEYDEIIAGSETPGNNMSPVCWQRQELTVFDSPCLRYPFGVQHSSTLGSDDQETANYLKTIYSAANYGNFSEGRRRKYHNAHRIKTIGWQGYCELETEASNLQSDWSAYDQDAMKFRYCQNDPLTLAKRETLCSAVAPHFVMYAWALTDRRVANACNYRAKLCIVIPGYVGSGRVSSIMESPDLPDVEGFTFLIMPIAYDIISEYFARRALFEVGNSFGRSLDMHLHDVTDEMREKYKPKHPLDLKPRDTVRFDNADATLNDSDASYTGIAVDVDAFAVLAKVPDFLTVDDAIHLMDVVISQINATCRVPSADASIPRDRWKRCANDADRENGVFLMPHLNAPLEADHLRELPLAEVYRPYPSDKIIVDVPRLVIRSAVKSMPLRFSPDPFVDKVKHRSTCNYIHVGAQAFELHNAEFNQTLCKHLDPSKQVPVILSGSDISDAYLELKVFFGKVANSTIGTAVLLLGDDNRVFEASKTLVGDNIKIIATLLQVDDNNNVVPWDSARDMYFHAAVAKMSGDINFMPYRHGEPSSAIRSVLIQERLDRNGGALSPHLSCKDNFCSKNELSVFVCGSFNQSYSKDLCRILNVTSATGVFGSRYEAEVYHELSDKTHIYVSIAIVLSILAAAIFFINLGLLFIDKRIVHRMVGLFPPLSHDEIVAHFRSFNDNGKKGRKKRKGEALEDGQWHTIHPDSHNRHGFDFGYGVAVKLSSGQKYNVEQLARDMRRGNPIPPEIVQDYPQLVELLQKYNRKIQ